MENLSELAQYHFPNISPERLYEEPYRSYIQIYCSLSAPLKFYRGFIKPQPLLQAKIYRAVRLAYGSYHEEPPADFCMIFRSSHGLVIKVREVLPEFDRLFNYHLSQPDNCVFLPNGYDRLDQHEFPYYHDLLSNFRKNNLQLIGKSALVRCSENNSDFLFLCLSEPIDFNLSSQWHEYLHGGIRRTVVLTPNQVPEAFRRFRWSERSHFQVEENQVKMTVKCTSLDEFKERIDQIPEEDGWNLLNLGIMIENEQEAFGLIARVGRKELIPLIGTTWVCLPSILNGEVESVLKEEVEMELPEGNEVFTQVEFSEMSSLQKSSLIQSPTGQPYSILGLVEQIQGGSKIDPLTRQPYSEEFLKEVETTIDRLRGPLLEGFPPYPFNPQLITICPDHEEMEMNEPSISFYLQSNELDTHLFWKIPDLRRTEFASLTFEAIRVLVLRWTDRSLFRNYRPERRMNPNLVFSPAAYYVFEKNTQEIDLGKFPTEKNEQADRLREQIYILQTHV